MVFEVASRSLSFTRAAEELGVSRVAVSRQIADLERSLGQTLFVRGHREVSLTAAGVSFANQVNPALSQISEALNRQRAHAKIPRISVTVTAAFATYWLMPRLAEFGAHHPDVEVNLVVSDRYLDLAAEEIDIAVRYCPTTPTGMLDCRELFREMTFPVMSPKYKARTNLERPSDLLQENLLDLAGPYRTEARWAYWFKEQGFNPPATTRGVRVNTYLNMLQAAIEGQGIALGGTPLVDSYLADGSLVRVPGFNAFQRDPYFLIRRSDGIAAHQFCNWIEEQMQQHSPAA